MNDDYAGDFAIEEAFREENDAIGVACSCHLNFRQFCIIEIGSHVEKIK